MDQSVRELPDEDVRITVLRCVDCGAFTSHNEPMHVPDKEGGHEDGSASGVREPRNPAPTPDGLTAFIEQ